MLCEGRDRRKVAEQLPKRHFDAHACLNLLHETAEKERIETEFQKTRVRLGRLDSLAREFLEQRGELTLDLAAHRVRGRSYLVLMLHVGPLQGRVPVRRGARWRECSGRCVDPIAVSFEGIGRQRDPPGAGRVSHSVPVRPGAGAP